MPSDIHKSKAAWHGGEPRRLHRSKGRERRLFEAKGFGWAYGDKPTFVLTSRDLPRTRETVAFYSGDLVQFVNRPSMGCVFRTKPDAIPK